MKPDTDTHRLWCRVQAVRTVTLTMGFAVASHPRAKNTGQRATEGTVLTSQSLSPWCDCRRVGSTWASWRWQDINVGNPLRRRALLSSYGQGEIVSNHVQTQSECTCHRNNGIRAVFRHLSLTSTTVRTQ